MEAPAPAKQGQENFRGTLQLPTHTSGNAHLHCTEQRGMVGFGAFYGGSKRRQNLKHLIFLYLKWR